MAIQTGSYIKRTDVNSDFIADINDTLIAYGISTISNISSAGTEILQNLISTVISKLTSATNSYQNVMTRTQKQNMITNLNNESVSVEDLVKASTLNNLNSYADTLYTYSCYCQSDICGDECGFVCSDSGGCTCETECTCDVECNTLESTCIWYGGW